MTSTHQFLHSNDSIDSDKVREECGVFAIYSKESHPTIFSHCFYGLLALQHRGQESAGITLSNDGVLETIKGMGLVTDVFHERNCEKIKANAAIAHVRYSTTGDSNLANAQPLAGFSSFGQCAIAHNGNLTNIESIKSDLQSTGTVFQSSTDTEIILNLLSKNFDLGMKEAIAETCRIVKGAFALILLIAGKLVGVRDPQAIRPLCLGYIHDSDSYVLASESRAFYAVGAEFIRDINAGEMVIIDDDGLSSYQYAENSHKRMCSFEYIYFAKPDSRIDGLDVHTLRQNSGAMLFHQRPVDADVVIGVPDSGTAAAIGYANASCIPFNEGLIRNRHVGRTFILPLQHLRQRAVKLKFNPIKSVIQGKRVVVVDDSLVRGTTAKQLIAMMRDAGANEIHFRIASPMVQDVCHFGIDIPHHEQLLAYRMTVEEIRKYISADSLEYLSLDNLSLLLGSDHFCKSCFGVKKSININMEESDVNLQTIGC